MKCLCRLLCPALAEVAPFAGAGIEMCRSTGAFPPSALSPPSPKVNLPCLQSQYTRARHPPPPHGKIRRFARSHAALHPVCIPSLYRRHMFSRFLPLPVFPAFICRNSFKHSVGTMFQPFHFSPVFICKMHETIKRASYCHHLFCRSVILSVFMQFQFRKIAPFEH